MAFSAFWLGRAGINSSCCCRFSSPQRLADSCSIIFRQRESSWETWEVFPWASWLLHWRGWGDKKGRSPCGGRCWFFFPLFWVRQGRYFGGLWRGGKVWGGLGGIFSRRLVLRGGGPGRQ